MRSMRCCSPTPTTPTIYNVRARNQFHRDSQTTKQHQRFRRASMDEGVKTLQNGMAKGQKRKRNLQI